MKKTLLAVAIAAASTTAFADTKVSGHVNYVFGDIEELGDSEDFHVGDAGISQSRFRITSDTEANGITYGLRQEFGLTTGASNIDLDDPDSTEDEDQILIRVNEFYLKGSAGKFSVGQGSEAGDGFAERDFSGTYVLNSGGLGTWNLGTNADGDELGFAQPEPSRTERIRYDSPKLGGIAKVVLDLQDDDDTTIGVSAGGPNWKAAIYSESRDADDSDEVGGSIAVKFGVFTASYAIVDRDETDGGADDNFEYDRIILGYRSGPYSAAVDFQTNERDNGLDRESTGLSFVYRPTKGVELYAGWREVENKATDADGDGILFGGRVKF